ncbi:proline oxidase [Fusarium langsethiae]|uniref:Proline dehydrogenase n=1 Tax=Fusarium langsethiae TaxID=179993 RepID=A0A0N0DCL3_FUSLA|nr:proline oxidase [Fusarium langsethiae]
MLSLIRLRPSRSLRDTLQRVLVHSMARKGSTSSYRRTRAASGVSLADPTAEGCVNKPRNGSLAAMPLGSIIRSLFITSVSCSAILQVPIIRMMLILAHSENPILNPDKNPFLHFLLKKTFYAQFCGGETPAEVRLTMKNLKAIGFNGVILTYAKEAMMDPKAAQIANIDNICEETDHDISTEIEPWHNSTMETINLAESGDFVALKLTGSGRVALHLLSQNKEPSPSLSRCIHTICASAQNRGIRLIFDAEQDAFQTGIDSWTMMFARKYNTADATTLYGTYQAYRKATPATISRHLSEAQEGGFKLGVKLVRGAYLGSDPRGCFWNTKSETDTTYDSITSAILTRQWNPITAGKGKFPNTHLVLATHNTDSVNQARDIYEAGSAKSGAIVAQLQGMADEIGYEIIQARDNNRSATLPTYKYLVWGTTGECMKYLVRRAYENRDAVQRTKSSRDTIVSELIARVKRTFSFYAQ